MAKYICTICGYIYDEAVEGTKFNDLPDTWTCPTCGAPKSVFEKVPGEEDSKASDVKEEKAIEPDTKELEEEEVLKELTYGQLSLICSNLAKGCEKEYKAEDAKLFFKLSDDFKSRARSISTKEIKEVEKLLNEDLNAYAAGKKLCSDNKDRGALRALTWNEKVSRMAASVISQYKEKGESLLDDVNIYVCEICGFIYIGKELPRVCPVCKVPSFKMVKVEL